MATTVRERWAGTPGLDHRLLDTTGAEPHRTALTDGAQRIRRRPLPEWVPVSVRESQAGPRERDQPSEAPPTTKAPAEPAKLENWCAVSDELDPGLMLQVHRRDANIATPVSFEITPGQVLLHLAPIPASLLAQDLPRPLIYMFIIVPMFYFLGMVRIGLNMMLAGFCIVGLNPVGFFVCVYESFVVVWECLVQTFNWFAALFRLIQRIVAIVSQEPWIYVPPGMTVENGIVAAINANAAVQVLRVRTRDVYLKRRSTRGEGLVKTVTSMAMAPIMFMLDVSSSQKDSEANAFALVEGTPLNLQQPDQGGQRFVHLISIPSSEADHLQHQMEAALGRAIPVVDEKVAEATIWAN